MLLAERLSPKWNFRLETYSWRQGICPLKRQTDLAKVLIAEYFLFDPKGEYLRPALRGYSLTPLGMYSPISPNPQARLTSVQLGLELEQDGSRLRFFDPNQGQFLLTPAEEASRRQAAEEEITRLKAELDRLSQSKRAI